MDGNRATRRGSGKYFGVTFGTFLNAAFLLVPRLQSLSVAARDGVAVPGVAVPGVALHIIYIYTSIDTM